MTDSEKFDLILAKLSNVDAKINDMDTKINDMDTKINTMQNDMKDIKMTLDNEIRVNIQRVAEGHLDLSRNLHNAIKPNSEVEILAIKVATLESEIRELKRKIS